MTDTTHILKHGKLYKGASRSGRLSIRASLILLMSACVLPALLVSVFLVYVDYVHQREHIFREAISLSGSIAAGLDRELSGLESGLRVLATSPELEYGNLAAFYSHAQDARVYQIADNYVVIDKDGNQRLNTLKPLGMVLPKTGTPLEVQRVFSSGTAVVSGLFVGPVRRFPMASILVPVFHQGTVVYALGTALSSDHIGAILGRQSVPDGWIVAVFDQTGTLLARSKDPQRYVGEKAVPMLIEQAINRKEGSLETLTKEGIPAITAFSRSEISNWTVAVGAPKTILIGALYRSIALTAFGAAIAFGLALLFAAKMARRIGRAVNGLIEPALALGSGRPVALGDSRLLETNAVGHALVKAAQMLANAEHMASHDVLTGLCNRKLFENLATRELAAAKRKNNTFAIAAIDLDEFKEVNDQQGHAAGDFVLQIAAERIRSGIRASDAAARWGGDEFVVLLCNTDENCAKIVGEKFVEALSEPYPDVLQNVSASVGIAMYPHSGDSVAALLARADLALYEAKLAGKRRLFVDFL